MTSVVGAPGAGPLDARWPEQVSWTRGVSWGRLAAWVMPVASLVSAVLLGGLFLLIEPERESVAFVVFPVAVLGLYGLFMGFIVFQALRRGRRRKQDAASGMGLVAR